LTILSLINLVAAVGITVVVPLLGSADTVFGVDQRSAMWLMTAFMLFYASFMPIFGKLSDTYGRKKVFIASSFIYSAGLLISALSRNFILVVIGRAVQGFGSGGILPVANAMAVEMNPQRREKALSIVNATYGIGMIVGVNLGGILYERVGYKSVFLVPFIAQIVLTVLALFTLEETIKTFREHKIDILGSVLFALSMMSFILGMQSEGFKRAVYFSVLAVLVAVFVLTELKSREPSIDVRLFAKPSYALSNITALLFGVAMFTTVTFLPSFAQLLLSWDVEKSVYAVDPFALAMAVSIGIGGALSRRVGFSIALSIGMVSLGVTALIFARFAEDAMSFFLLSVLLGFSLGLSMTPMNDAAMRSAGEEKKGEAAGVVSVMRSVGGTIGPAIAGYILSKTDLSSLFALDNLIEAHRSIISMAGYSAILGALVSLIAIPLFKKEVVL